MRPCFFLKAFTSVCLKFSLRLNLFNHVLALFRAKFVCISAIRYHVFRWESCKGCVWEVVKNSSVCVHSKAFSRLELTSSLRMMTSQNATRVKHARSWRVTTAGALQDKKGQSGQSVIARLELATYPSREVKSPESPILQKNDFSYFSHTQL